MYFIYLFLFFLFSQQPTKLFFKYTKFEVIAMLTVLPNSILINLFKAYVMV